MDRSESANEADSSPDTVIGRSSSEDDQKRNPGSTSAEYVTVDDSSSSLDTLTGGGMEEKKRRRFDVLKNSFRKEGGLFGIKRKTLSLGKMDSEDFAEVEPEVEITKGGMPNKGLEKGRRNEKKKKKKKSHSLVQKLSLSKLRLSSEQEPRHRPEGGDSSRSQSRSPQESPSHSSSPPKLTRVGPDSLEKVAKERENDRKPENEKGEEKSEKFDKPVSTVTVVQRRSPSLTIRSIVRDVDHLAGTHELQNWPEKTHVQPSDTRRPTKCTVSTLPYAISKWPQQDPESVVKARMSKSLTISGSEEPPTEVRRKLSLLDEKRAIFQYRLLNTTLLDSFGTETVSAVSGNEEILENCNKTERPKRQARYISVRNVDTFSTFEGSFDENTEVGYLTSIRENYSENIESSEATMPAPSTEESSERPNQESTSSQISTVAGAVVEKKEHLYKILVIGELGAGKTSIIKRYVHQFFSQHYRATIGVDFALKVLNWDPQTIIRLQLWDIAGQERFGNMTRVYYKEAVGAFIVFDVTRGATLEAVVKWKQDLDSKVQLSDGSPIPCVLLANKCDQQKEGLVNTPAKMDEYCKEKNFAGWFETSAKENINIEEAARFLVDKILENDQMAKGNGSQEQKDGGRFILNQTSANTKKTCSC